MSEAASFTGAAYGIFGTIDLRGVSILPPHLALRIPFEADAHKHFLFGLSIAGSNDTDSSVLSSDCLVGDAVNFWQTGEMNRFWRRF